VASRGLLDAFHHHGDGVASCSFGWYRWKSPWHPSAACGRDGCALGAGGSHVRSLAGASTNQTIAFKRDRLSVSRK
jgi:hypothetical protein